MPSGSTRTWNFASGAPPGAGHVEIDLDQHRGAADAHGRDRRVDLHVAVLGRLAGDEGDGARHQADQRRIVRPVGVVDHFVEHHSRVRREAEHGAVDEGDAERRIGAGLDDVAFFDVVAVVQDDRNAVANDGRGARELGDMADHLGGARAAAGLRVFGVAGQRVDEIAGEVRAIGRRQRRALLALEVIVQDQFVVVMGKDRSTPARLKSPLNSSCASGTMIASAGACVACLVIVSTWACPWGCRPGPSAENVASNFPA